MKIHINGVQKTYSTLRKKTEVLKNINITVEDREFFVLLGPSGCGKSTLLNIIAGLEPVTGGELRFGDRLVASVNKKDFVQPKDRNVAMVFQNYALYPHLTVFENIAFPLRIARAGAEEIKKCVEKSAEILKISKHLQSKPAELSGGERQRVAIARAIVRRPDVLLFDEPLSNLDAQLRTATRVELKKLQRELGITTVYVTHDQVEAMTLGDRVAVLKDGLVQQLDTAIGLYERPANRFVAQFIGFPQINIFETEVKNGAFSLCGADFPAPAQAPSGPVWAGIRPSDLELKDGGALNGRVDTMELLGRDAVLYVSCGQLEFAILSERKDLREGDAVKFSLKPGKAHCFPR